MPSEKQTVIIRKLHHFFNILLQRFHSYQIDIVFNNKISILAKTRFAKIESHEDHQPKRFALAAFNLSLIHIWEYESCGFRTADAAFLDAEEPQDTRPQNPGIPAFRTADSDVPEPQNPGASNTDFSQPDTSFSDVSLSVPSEDGPTLSLIHIYKYHLNTFKC